MAIEVGSEILDIFLDIFDPRFRHFLAVENYEICLKFFDKNINVMVYSGFKWI